MTIRGKCTLNYSATKACDKTSSPRGCWPLSAASSILFKPMAPLTSITNTLFQVTSKKLFQSFGGPVNKCSDLYNLLQSWVTLQSQENYFRKDQNTHLTVFFGHPIHEVIQTLWQQLWTKHSFHSLLFTPCTLTSIFICPLFPYIRLLSPPFTHLPSCPSTYLLMQRAMKEHLGPTALYRCHS